MSSKSKVSISVCLLLAVSICICSQVPLVRSWGGETHQSIASEAIKLMPTSFDWFFQTYSSTIVSYSSRPDSWKSSDPMESPRHFYDSEIMNGVSAVLTTENYLGIEIPVYDEGAIPNYASGDLPWNLVDNFNMFVVCLEENDWAHAAQLAGAIGHYVGDASMPLHATVHYNPGNPSGNHTAYEGTVDSNLDEIDMNISGFVPHEIDNVFDSTMQLLDDSYSYVSVLSPYLENNILWNDNIKNMTENRVRTGAQLLADMWYTAFDQAGILNQPLSSTPSATPTDYTPYIIGGVLAIVVIIIALLLYMRRR